jgi:hypothetical protein
LKIPLVGQSSESRSPAVSAQACVNVFPQLVGDPNENEKNVAILLGRPGIHIFKTLAGLGLGDVRGLWSGAGRCFVAAGLNLLELSSTGTVLSNIA